MKKKISANQQKPSKSPGAREVYGENAVLTAIAAMPEPDRNVGERLHVIIRNNAPSLMPRTWYGMPAYANDDGEVICFFRSRDKFKERYMTLGFNQGAKLDSGNMWPIVFALTKLTADEEAKISALIKKAIP